MCSPIFRVPVKAEVQLPDQEISFVPSRMIYSFKFPFHYLLLLSCAISLALKRFSSMAYSAVFMPLIFLLLTWAMFYLY